MDTVITCNCGSQSWVIGMSGTRCSKCMCFLKPESVLCDVEEINNFIQQGPSDNENKTFKKELETLLNRYGLDNECNTPDFMLVDYLISAINSLKLCKKEFHRTEIYDR